MKLFLHWLRYDLRRFRLMLGAWTLMVAAYAVFLGWLNVNILTVNAAALSWSQPIAMVLGVFEIIFLFALFSTDPAKGPHHFWKTRPPTGRAIAGVKLTIALGFLVLLPLLVWQWMTVICVTPGYAVTKSPTGLSWPAFLFWAQSLMVSAFALAAARAANGKTLYLRLLVPVGIVAFGVLAAHEAWNLFAKTSIPGTRWDRWLRDSFFSLPMAVLALSGASFFLLHARRRRFSSGAGWRVLILLPVIVIVSAAVLYWKPLIHPPDESLPPAAPAIAGKIRIREMAYPRQLFRDRNFTYAREDPREAPAFLASDSRLMGFSVAMKIEGLPPETLISARWLNLRLTATDGTIMDADSQLSMPPPGTVLEYGPDDELLLPWEAVFPTKKRSFSDLIRCTGHGTLRLTLYSRQNLSIPLLDGHIHPTRLGPLRQQSRPSLEFSQAIQGSRVGLLFFNLAFLDPGNTPPARLSAVNSKENLNFILGAWGREKTTGFLLSQQLSDGVVSVNQLRKGAHVQEAEALQASYAAGTLPADWQLILDWNEPVSIMDFPVTLHDIILSGGSDPGLLAALEGIHPAENTSDEKVRGDLRHACALISKLSDPLMPWPRTEKRRAIPLWKRILSEVPHARLPVLLEFHEEEPSTRIQSLRLPEFLNQRIRELLQPADIQAILANPALAEKLRDVLPAAAVPSPAPAAPEHSPDGTRSGKPAQ